MPRWAFSILLMFPFQSEHKSKQSRQAPAHLEASGAPVDELDGALGLDGGDGGVDVLGNDVTTVQHAAGHVLAVTGVALHQLTGGLEAGVGDLSHRQLLVVGLFGGDDGSVGGQREVDTWVGHQVGLELSEIHVEGTIEAQRSGDGGNYLSHQSVEVGVGGALDVQVTAADVVDGFIVDHKGAVGVLQSGVGGQDGVVGLNHSGGDLKMIITLITACFKKVLLLVILSGYHDCIPFRNNFHAPLHTRTFDLHFTSSSVLQHIFVRVLT